MSYNSNCSVLIGSHVHDPLCRSRGIKTASASDAGRDIKWTFCRTAEPACAYPLSFQRTRASIPRLPAISKEMQFAQGSSMWSLLHRLALQLTCPPQRQWAESGETWTQSPVVLCFKTPNIPGANYYRMKNKYWNSAKAEHWQCRQLPRDFSLLLFDEQRDFNQYSKLFSYVSNRTLAPVHLMCGLNERFPGFIEQPCHGVGVAAILEMGTLRSHEAVEIRLVHPDW